MHSMAWYVSHYPVGYGTRYVTHRPGLVRVHFTPRTARHVPGRA